NYQFLIQIIMKIYTFFTIICFFVLSSCATYKYTREQYDRAMRQMAVGKQISSFMSTCPFKYQNYPDGNGGSIVKLDLSTSLSTPSSIF
ncbi:MAG: hypothetical protein WCP21_11935, partial [Armatimonadota bacterium]